MHRSSRIVAACAATSFILTACSPTDESAESTAPESSTSSTASAGSEAPSAGGTLIYASGDAEPTCLDPHVGGNYPQALVSSLYLETLFTQDPTGKTVPYLAESSEVSDDGLTHTITVREGITFHDGTPLTAEAVKANIEHLQDPDTKSSTGYLAVSSVESVEVTDEMTAVLHLSVPDNALEESLSQLWTAIQSPTALERDLETNCGSPVGTGPFQVESWERQQAINVVAYEDYVAADDPDGDAPYLDGITWRFIPEAATRYAALQSGEVDVIDNAQPDTIKAATDSDQFGHLDAPRPGASNRLEFNSSKPPFDDPLVREAFIRAVDVDSGIDSLFFGTAQRSYSLLSSVENLGVSREDLFFHDPDKANELLDEAGWEMGGDGVRVKDGERLEIILPVSTNQSVPAEQSLFEQFQAQAGEVGFDMKIELLDLSSWYGALGEHNYNLVSAPYTKVGPAVLRILFHSDSTKPAPSGYFANHAMVVDDEIDQLLVDAEETSDPAERADLYEKAQNKVLEGYYVLPLYDQQNHFLYRTEVESMGAITPVATPLYTLVHLKK
ncbi:MAG: ABC transporter substrate-binding protein [Flaviflexus sp.]|nr:ABC transporter substrate-binding protein [Flaviflexus sp.]